MTVTVSSILVSIVYVAVLRWAWRVLNWVWFRPKKVERCLRQQGFAGKPYRLLFGDWKESSDMLKEARTKPIGLSDALLPRVMPFLHQQVNDYALSFANSCALSMPPQSITNAVASSREPLPRNSVISLSFGDFSRANITGAVRFPFARSLPDGFPGSSADCVKSNMSSATWKHRPRFLPYSYVSTHALLSTPLKIAAPLVLAAIKEAVL